MIVYTVTKIFGVDAVKTRVFYEEPNAIRAIEEDIKMCTEENQQYEIVKRSHETYYILNRSETKPTEYIEFVLRRCEIL